jgi:hypothetical protein
MSKTTTWREALKEAQAGIGKAEERRSEVFRAANDAGLSLRQIAGVVGVSAATVSRIIDRPDDERGDILDAPVGVTGLPIGHPQTNLAHTSRVRRPVDPLDVLGEA